jgi:hypothetical protein
MPAKKIRKVDITMKQIITTIVCLLASLATVNGAAAQQHAVRAFIPFNFSAAGAELPAGNYTIATQYGLTWITKNGSGKRLYVKARPANGAQPNDSKLIFSNSGDRVSLQKVLCPQINMSLELLPSKSAIKNQAQAGNPGN